MLFFSNVSDAVYNPLGAYHSVVNNLHKEVIGLICFIVLLI